MAAVATLKTPKGVLSYPNLFVARPPKNPKPGQKSRYTAMIVFPKGTDLSGLKKAALDCAIEKLGQEKVVALLKDKKLSIGIREDLASKGWDTDLFTHFIQPWTTNQPGIVDRYRDPITGKAVAITDPNVIYAGCQVIASVRPFYYDQEGNKGVAWGLNNIQKVGEGERLDGRRAASDEFEATEDAPPPDASAPGSSEGVVSGGSAPKDAADELAALLR